MGTCPWFTEVYEDMCIDKLDNDPNPEVIADLFLDNGNLTKDEFTNKGWN